MLTRPVPAGDPTYELWSGGIRQVKAIPTVHLYRVIGVCHEDAHMFSFHRTGGDSVTGERPWTTVQNPGSVARNTSFFQQYWIEEEMNMQGSRRDMLCESENLELVFPRIYLLCQDQ